jgi:hypothetical protein
VGVGTRYGAGCTSGHGVCGLSRLSPRSAAATAVLMAAGFATVFVVRHLAAWEAVNEHASRGRAFCEAKAVLVVAAMLGGMALFELVEVLRWRR